jgi:hypothetical protein
MELQYVADGTKTSERNAKHILKASMVLNDFRRRTKFPCIRRNIHLLIKTREDYAHGVDSQPALPGFIQLYQCSNVTRASDGLSRRRRQESEGCNIGRLRMNFATTHFIV